MDVDKRTGVPVVVVTSISSPNRVLSQIANDCVRLQYRFIVVGDAKSPSSFDLRGCEFYSLAAQRALPFSLAACLPEKHYARKNLAYLIAIASGAPFIIETDDDNIPGGDFYVPLNKKLRVPLVTAPGWTNAYSHFSDARVWPRGLPLDAIGCKIDADTPLGDAYCPIQQGLANGDPDVDAVYRLVLPLPFIFERHLPIAIGGDAWSPFNSQNTTFFPESFALMYLPSLCPFRMTDIWRSFIAQRIAREHGWATLYRGPTVFQDRNEHDLMRDFEDEMKGYLLNRDICAALDELCLVGGNASNSLSSDLFRCYSLLVDRGVFPREELALLSAWLRDIDRYHKPVHETG